MKRLPEIPLDLINMCLESMAILQRGLVLTTSWLHLELHRGSFGVWWIYTGSRSSRLCICSCN